MKSRKIKSINIFLPGVEYTEDRNNNKVKHHLFDLYSSVFRNFPNVRVFPTRKYPNIFYAFLSHYIKIERNSINVITQGYSVLSIFFAQITRKDVFSVIHTWNIPGFSEERLSS